jgi:alkylation response protein AidB-like acyl-CoA dehydrogenase
MAGTTGSGNPGSLESREIAESAREKVWVGPSFLKELFLGRLDLDLIYPHPEPDKEEEERAIVFLEQLAAFMRTRVDSDKIDRDGKIPEALVEELRRLRAFGIKIPREYGGLGFSQVTYNRALELISSQDGNISALISAHQSIGVPQPLKLFGTPEQKSRYFPRLARGAISAFALTEHHVGSDPANIRTSATPTSDGSAFILNGEKLWCTNGTRAELLVVMARTPSKITNGREKKQITAFIVEMNWPGVEVVRRCHFMGLKALENGIIRFHNVQVPRENILWKEGAGLKLALTTLNTGRLTLPACAAGVAKTALRICRRWANDRIQWGAPIGRHEAVAEKIGRMAATTFALESISELCASMADRGGYDIRLEAALAKLFNSEAGWRIVDDMMQIRGGRGYETAASLSARGEAPIAVERIMRDFRINLIFEGSSEIMRLFLAREAVDYHLQLGGALLNPQASIGSKIKAILRSGLFYAGWFPRLWFGKGCLPAYRDFGPLAPHMRFVERSCRKLARMIFYAILRYGPKLEKRQMILFRFVDAGAELFAMTACCVRARMLETKGQDGDRAIGLADHFCRLARRRMEETLDAVFHNNDRNSYRLATQVLQGEHVWLESGIMDPCGRSDRAPEPAPEPVRLRDL